MAEIPKGPAWDCAVGNPLKGRHFSGAMKYETIKAFFVNND